MSMNNKIRAAVLPVVSVCVPDLYTGEKTTYCTFQYTEMPQAFGDDMPQITVYLVQLHLFAPCGERMCCLCESSCATRCSLLDLPHRRWKMHQMR